MTKKSEGREHLPEHSQPKIENLNTGADYSLISQEKPKEICAICSALRADDPVGRDSDRCDTCASYRPRPDNSGPGNRMLSFPQSIHTKTQEGRYDIAA